jgi:hypothetical protein
MANTAAKQLRMARSDRSRAAHIQRTIAPLFALLGLEGNRDFSDTFSCRMSPFARRPAHVARARPSNSGEHDSASAPSQLTALVICWSGFLCSSVLATVVAWIAAAQEDCRIGGHNSSAKTELSHNDRSQLSPAGAERGLRHRDVKEPTPRSAHSLQTYVHQKSPETLRIIYSERVTLRQLVSVHPNDRLINDILGQSQRHLRRRPSFSKALSHPTSETEPGANQLRAAPPASTQDSLTNAQIHAIIVDTVIDHSNFK